MGPRIVVGGKVSGADFFDREALLDRVWSHLPHQSVELVAPRRFGKTGVMLRLADEPRNGCRVLYLDCEAFADPVVFLRELRDLLAAGQPGLRPGHMADDGRAFLGRIFNRIRKVGGAGFTLELSDPSSPTWTSSIRELLQASRAHQLPTVAILDEFSMMLENFVRAKLDATLIVGFLNWFRRLRQEQGDGPPLVFVIGGSMNLEYWLRRLNASAMMNDVHREEVEAFDTTTAEALIRELLASERREYDDEVPAAILRHIEPAVPFWIQLMVWSLTQQGGTGGRSSATDVDRAYRERVLGPAGRHYFQPFEERLSREEPSVQRAATRMLTLLAQAPSDEGVPRSTLALIFAQVTGEQSPEPFDALFADLQSDFYIRWDQESDRCAFAHKVLRDWWLRWHPSAAGAAASEERSDGQ